MTNQQEALEALAHELYTAAQLAQGEGIEDAVGRLAALVEAQQPAPSAAADLIAALVEVRSAINSMKAEAETAGQGDEQMMLEACETISNEGLQADMAIRAALASAPRPAPSAAVAVGQEPPGIHALMCVISSLRDTAHFSDEEGEVTDDLRTLRDWALAQAAATQPSPTPQADSQPAEVWDYPPLPDFDTVEQHIYGACRRYITQDMLEPIHNLIRDAIDADRAQAKEVASHG